LTACFDAEFGGKSTSLNIEYPFIQVLLSDYEKLKMQFTNGVDDIIETGGWRDDMKFVFHLTRAFRFLEDNGRYSQITPVCRMSNRVPSGAVLAFAKRRIN